MNGHFHELFNTISLILIIYFFHNKFPTTLITVLSIAWILQTFYLNNDLDSRKSNSKKRIGIFKYLFIPFKHRGVFHKIRSWILLCIIILAVILNKAPEMLNIGLFGCIGLLGSSICHIVVDLISTKIKRVF